MRRSLLQLLAGLPLTQRGDGLVKPMNAPPAQVNPPGVQPGALPAVLIAREVIIIGPAGTPVGVFVYQPGVTPKPGGGTVPTDWVTQATKDPFGTTIPATGVGDRNPSSGAYAALHGGSLQLWPGSGNATGSWAATAGTITGVSPKETAGDATSSIALESAAAAGLASGNPAVVVPSTLFLNTVPGMGQWTAQQPGSSPAAAEVPHPMSLLNNWAATGGFAGAHYQLLSQSSTVWVVAVLDATSANAATFFTLPPGYVPTKAAGAPVGATGGVPAGSAPDVRWDTSGNLTINNINALPIAASFFVNVLIPLN